MLTVTAEAHPNIALVKYWGKRDLALNLPSTSSLALTLGGFATRTTVTWGEQQDEVLLDGAPASAQAAARVLRFLDLVDPDRPPCRVQSASNFPVAAGLASSSSAFAALALAATEAAGRHLDPARLSALARRGSGSACRSLAGGFVHWRRGDDPDGVDSFALPVAPDPAWELAVVVAVVHGGPKVVGSTEGMLRSADTSPCYPAFVAQNERLVAQGLAAVAARDLPALAEVMERSTLLMQASMSTAWPPIRYLRSGSLAVLERIEALRAGGLVCGWTMDAGPNVKVVCSPADAEAVRGALAPLVSAAHVLGVGGPARVVRRRVE
ncbi:MAG: diphosphomevalonate decarboxylase [Pseudomonadota bacterium]